MRFRPAFLYLLGLFALAHCGSEEPGVPSPDGSSVSEDAPLNEDDASEAAVPEDRVAPDDSGALEDASADASKKLDVAPPEDAGVEKDAQTPEDVAVGMDVATVRDVSIVMDAGVDRFVPPADRGNVVDVPRDAGTTTDRGTTVMDVPVDRGTAVMDVPVDRGSVVDVPVDRGSVMDVPVDRGSVMDVPVDRGSVMDVPIDRGSVMDVPVDRGTTVMDVPVDRGTTVDVPRDTGALVDVRDVPVTTDVPRIPADDPVVYSGTFPARTGRFSATLTVLAERRSVNVVVPRSNPTNAPLVLAFHGTNGDGNVMLDESGAAALADQQNVIVVAPTSRWLPTGDFDHDGAETYWETAPNWDVDRNQDIVLVRAIIQEARRVYRIDPTRVYAIGHSNGGFFSLFVSQLLRDRVAAFSENAGGLVRCTRRAACGFQGTGTTCAALQGQRGWCNCTGPELPVALATSGRRPPGQLVHGTADPLVSVYYTCALETRMRELGYTWQTRLTSGEGHVVSTTYAQTAWTFLAPLRLQ
jgi:poly(3-hydroxybutyrate) depolymerase